MVFSDLERITRGTIHLSSDQEISKFTTDTRSLTGEPGEVFVAIRGANRNGYDFVSSAIALGTKNFIVEETIRHGTVNAIVVEDAVAAFQKIAAYYRAKFEFPVIGITGSNGKTIVKEWVSTLLSQKYAVVKSPKSFNSQIGVPLSILEIRANHELGVFEAGISKKGEMINLEKIIQPTLGIFTSLGAAHAGGFTSEEEKLKEKLLLFTNCDQLICRNDVPWFSSIQEEIDGSRLITWSLTGNANHSVSWSDGSISVDEETFKTNLQSMAERENITHSIVAAQALGLSSETIQEGLNLIRSIPMRLELKKGINGCYLLDDSYNNDLVGLKVAMDYLDAHQQNEKKTLILSDILQSAQTGNDLYQEVSNLIDQKNFDRLIGVGKNISAYEEGFHIETEFFESTNQLLENLPVFSNEMILIKGARNYELERVVRRLEEKNHGTVLEVNFESIRHNLNQYRQLLEPAVKLMVMVKANAYGSGILEVSNFLQHEKVDWLGVAYVDEAISLRNNGIDLPIMIMNPHVSSFSQFERYNLEAEIFSLSHLSRLVKDTKKTPAIHLKIDTGMHRLGFSEAEIPSLIKYLAENPSLTVASIFTHFSSSDNPKEDSFTIEQAARFDRTYQELSETLGYRPIKHACNSPAMVRWPQYHYDMVRLGIGLHGFDPTNTLELRPTSHLKTIISQIQHLKKGDTVGYSRKGKLERDSKIAVLPIGYEDGYLRIFGNANADVLINGRLCPTIGNICMDMTMVDVTDINAQEGDSVTIFGSNPSIFDLANAAGTIPYEILTNVSSRVKRVFVSE